MIVVVARNDAPVIAGVVISGEAGLVSVRLSTPGRSLPPLVMSTCSSTLFVFLSSDHVAVAVTSL